MSKIDENQIHERLKMLSQIEPAQESADHALQRVRGTVMNKEQRHERTGARIFKAVFRSNVAKLAAAAVLLIGFGYFSGRLSVPRPLDAEELQAALESSLKASLETAIRQDLIAQLNEQWQSAFADNSAQLKEELQRQVRRDLTEFAAQTFAAFGTLTNQRLIELIQSIEAFRMRERQQVTAAFQQIEQDKIRLENGLLAIAAQTSELRRTKQN